MKWRTRNSGLPPPTSGAEWVARLRSGELTREEREQARQWMAGGNQQVRDFLKAETVWRLSGALAQDAEVQRELAELDAQSTSRDVHWSDRMRVRTVSVAASLLAIGLGALAWYVASSNKYETARGEQRVMTLEDGSTVALNTNTRLKIQFSKTRRDIVLQHGEALFQVARDPARPFVVHAAQGYARAVGTRFNVLAEKDGVTVSVLEGRVAVSPTVTASQQVLSAGQSAAYVESGRLVVPEPTHASAERIAAWREGKLRFDSWRLDRAVMEYNRYADKPILLEASDAADLQISGVFRIDDSAAFIQALSELVNGQVVDTGRALALRPAAR